MPIAIALPCLIWNLFKKKSGETLQSDGKRTRESSRQLILCRGRGRGYSVARKRSGSTT